MDLDGDGRISMYEMEYFYEEQMRKLEQLDIEPLPFEDCICQVHCCVILHYCGGVNSQSQIFVYFSEGEKFFQTLCEKQRLQGRFIT